MMITGETPNCYTNGPQIMPIYEPLSEDQPLSSPLQPNFSSSTSTHTTNFLYNLSLLKDKTHQVQSLATILFSSDNHHGPPPPESTAIAFPTMGTLIQEIIVTASSMMFACQQMALGTSPSTTTAARAAAADEGPSTFFSNHQDQLDQWYSPDNYNNCNSNNNNNSNNYPSDLPPKKEITDIVAAKQGIISPKNYDIVELDAADLLAKYTHYCQVCGKGFKRDANLRMHMRAHGDEYKSTAALSNPAKNNSNGNYNGEENIAPRKYSCPQQGCRWNKNHAKFQPLKSMICVKNHYKRSHCPKMYVCKRCNTKQFSVLSDLRTHEKHCGDLKWQCSCGTTFSRKDKLMGHVALFVGHAPLITSTDRIIAAG